MKNRHGLVVDATLTHATGTAEREAALTMLARMRGRHRITLAADKNNTNRPSAIDGRTTQHPGYTVSLRIRKRIEEVFGWAKTSGNLRPVIDGKTASVGPSC